MIKRRKPHEAKGAVTDRIQKTFRFPVQLEREFTEYLKETGEEANTVVQGLIADLLERWYGLSLDATQLDYLMRFWKHLPAAAAIKEVRGRVILVIRSFAESLAVKR